jgi:hypothetical protein
LSCQQRGTYTATAITPQGLEALTRAALSDIQSSLNCNVQFGVSDASLADIRYNLSTSNADPSFLLIRNPRGVSRFIEKGNRAYVLNNDEWMANQRWTGGPMFVGRYLYGPAAILLHSFEGSGAVYWCRNTLIHEVLHSVSLYSRIWGDPPDLIPKHEPLNEGITEFLTGYVLFKKYPDCYVTWKGSAPGKCAVAYRERTKLFCSLAQIVGVAPIAKFYFSNGADFNAEWNMFIRDIQSLGFRGFRFGLDKNTAFREVQFREECMKSIPGFKKIYDSKVAVLDFSKVH